MTRLALTSLGFAVGILFLPAAASAQGALEAAEHAAEAAPRDAEAQLAYGRALTRAGRFRDADRVLRSAARLRGNTLEALYDVARVAFAQGDYQRSRRACQALERESRGAALTHVCRARAFLVWNRAGRAFEELERAESADGADFEVALAFGDAYRLRADLPNAEQRYQAAIAADARRAEPYLGLGLLYAASRRPDDARGALEAARERDPLDPEIALELAKLSPPARARTLYASVLEIRPAQAEALVALADLERAADDADAAISHYRRALEIDEADARALAGLGIALLDAGQAEEGEPYLRRAMELVPNDLDVALALGRLHQSRGENQEAFGQYRRAADLNARDPRGLVAAAALALELNRAVLATGYLDRLLQRHPDHAQALALYGDALVARGDRERAVQYYERALAASGELDRARVQRALEEARRAPERQQHLQRAAVAP